MSRAFTDTRLDRLFTKAGDVLEQHEPIFTREPGQRSPREQFFHDYLVHYTNAATLVNEDFKDTEDLAGLFAGFDPDQAPSLRHVCPRLFDGSGREPQR